MKWQRLKAEVSLNFLRFACADNGYFRPYHFCSSQQRYMNVHFLFDSPAELKKD
jgi:hypothetical protein